MPEFSEFMLLENIDDVFAYFDRKWRYMYVNRQAEILNGKKRDELLGKKVWDVFPTAVGSYQHTMYQKALKTNRRVTFEAQSLLNNKWYTYILHPSEKGIALFLIDISERKKLEEGLKQSEARFRSIVEQSNEAIQFISPQGKILYSSPSVKRVLGYTPEEVSTHTPENSLHPDDLPHFLKVFKRLLTHPEEVVHVQYRVKHKDGSWAWIEAEGRNQLKNPAIQAIVGNFRNITKKKQTEEALRASRDQLDAILANIGDGITVQDIHGKVVFANQAAAKATGNESANALISRTYKDYKSKFVLYDENGNVFPVEKLPGRRAFAGEENPSNLLKYVDTKNNETHWVIVKSKAIYDDNKKPFLVVNVITDITDRQELEARKDDFMNMVAHELKTPLTTTKVFSQILEKDFLKKKDRKSVEYIHKMNGQIDKLAELVHDLLDVTRINAKGLQMHKETFIIKDLAKEIIDSLQNITKHPIQFDWHTTSPVFADKERIRQVLMNLLTNAIKYSPQEKKIIVSSHKRDNAILVSVTDFGVGIPKKHQNKIFERFYQAPSNDGTYPGLGLGLYISSQIISQHQGKIWVESKRGTGSTFYFTLPIEQQS